MDSLHPLKVVHAHAMALPPKLHVLILGLHNTRIGYTLNNDAKTLSSTKIRVKIGQ